MACMAYMTYMVHMALHGFIWAYMLMLLLTLILATFLDSLFTRSAELAPNMRWSILIGTGGTGNFDGNLRPAGAMERW